jgi:hypothetical protein
LEEVAVSDVIKSFESIATRLTPPDPDVLKAIGLNHDLDSALADLIDNSLDAHARNVLVRFVLRDGLVSQLLIVDDGRGMNDDEIDSAMRLGGQRSDRGPALGHFGMGLKAASLSQASLLTVLSRQRGAAAVGRRLAREPKGSDFAVEELDRDQVEAALDTRWNDFSTPTGTIVLWDDIRTFPKARDRMVTTRFIDAKVSQLLHRLGLIFHRILERKTVSITIDVLNADTMEAGLPFEVTPIDPFEYSRAGVTGYPKTLVAECGSHQIPLHCHIWPGGSDSHSFKLVGRTVDALQGFYLYRHNRLLSFGGWGGVTHETKQRRLARVAVDVEDYEDAFSMSMEKAGVHMTADLVRAVELSVSEDGTRFADYLEDSEMAFKDSNRRVARRAKRLEPGQGIAPRVKRAISHEVDYLEGEDPVIIRWKHFPGPDFVDVDRRNRTLWLNTRYREALLKGTRGGINDAPVVKCLLYLLYEDIFRGTAYGPKDKDNVALWGEVLNAAAEEEWRDYYG